jgi:hypothetical protein
MDCALGNLKALRKFAAGNAAFGLKQHQRGEESVGLHGLESILSSKHFYLV